MIEWNSKTQIYAMFKKTHLKYKNKDRLKNKDTGKEILFKHISEESWITKLISEKVDFRTRSNNRNKERHYIINGKEELTLQEDIKILNINANKNRVSKYI